MKARKHCLTCGAAIRYRSGESRRYCSQACYHNGAAARLAPRFWGKVQANSADACWHWLGRRDPHGYGIFQVVGTRSRGAHRWAWLLTNGEIPAGVEVCHQCDTPSCVNPDHLFLGTHTTNIRDAITKGRLRPAQHLRKLTDQDHEDIRRGYVRGTAQTLAQRYGVCPTTIRRIVYGYPAARRHARELGTSGVFVRVPHVYMPVVGEVS